MQEINSVGLKSGFLASFAALALSSTFWVMVDLMVLAAGISMSLEAGLLASIFFGIVDVAEDAEELEVVVEDDEDDDDEQVLLSESESLCVLSVCPGMLPVVVSVSMCGLSELSDVECVLFVSVCVSVCLWILSFMSDLLATRGRFSCRGRCCRWSADAVMLLTAGASNRSA